MVPENRPERGNLARRVAWRGAPGLLLAAGLVVMATGPVLADTTAPTLAGFTFSPASIDTSDGPAGVLVTFHVTDDSSGVALARVTFTNRDVQADPQSCETTTRQSGTPIDGIFTCTVVFPQFSPPGTWQVFVVEADDVAGNRRFVTTAALAAQGFPTDLTLVTQPDTAPPVLSGFNFLPRAIDTSGAAGSIQVTFHVTDDRSGVAWAKVTFVGPGVNGTSRGCTSLVLQTGQDPSLDVLLSCTVDFPQFSTEGTWLVYGVDMADVAGNMGQYSTAGLASGGFPTELTVSTQTDTTPPALIDFTFNPAAIDTAEGGAAVQATMVVADDRTGVASAGVVFTSPGAPPQTQSCTSVFQDSGSGLTGTFRCTMGFPQDALEGIWTASLISVQDAAGNGRSYATQDLTQTGFPVDLAVGFVPGAPRAAVELPPAGRSVAGDSVTVAARLLQGSPAGVSTTQGVRFEYRALPSGTFAPIPAADPTQPNPDTTYPYLIHWDVTGLSDGDYEVRAVACDGGGNPDPAPAVETVHVSGVGADIQESVDAQGRQASRMAVDGASGAAAGSGNRTARGIPAQFTLPAGSLAQPADAVHILYPDPAGELSRLEQPGQSIGVFVDVTLESGQQSLQGGLSAGIEIAYPDANQDGVVDGTDIREEDLELRRLDPLGNTYVTLPPWTVLTEHNLVRGTTTQTGRFALTGPVEPRIFFQADAMTLVWSPMSGAQSYHVYRGSLSALRDTDGDGLPDGGYGTCQDGRDSVRTDTTFIDADLPGGPQSGFFYLVSYASAGGEKGLGTTSRGLQRFVAVPCP